MYRIKFDDKTGEHTILPKGSKEGFYFSNRLYDVLQNIQKIRAKGWDCIFLIDGPRRSGKSTLGQQCAKILQPSFNINHLAKGAEDASQKIGDAKDGDVLIIDEGSLVFNSKDAMKTEMINLMKIIDVVGQKKLVIIIILPKFFNLNKSIVSYSKFLLHVYADEDLNRGTFAFFGEDRINKLYSIEHLIRMLLLYQYLNQLLIILLFHKLLFQMLD